MPTLGRTTFEILCLWRPQADTVHGVSAGARLSDKAYIATRSTKMATTCLMTHHLQGSALPVCRHCLPTEVAIPSSPGLEETHPTHHGDKESMIINALPLHRMNTGPCITMDTKAIAPLDPQALLITLLLHTPLSRTHHQPTATRSSSRTLNSIAPQPFPLLRHPHLSLNVNELRRTFLLSHI